MTSRKDQLGFDPQKESIYNRLLPYADKIDDEALRVFAQIKGNLGRSVQLRDIKIGASHWVGQLSRYIRLYGLMFSKEDHIYLVKLLYEMIIIPDLELSTVQKFSNQLISLLKKRELLSREELELPWRPLYRLIESVIYSQYEQHGLQLFPINIESVLKNLVRTCRTYFSLDSTQEMLDEWRPLLCPFDITVIKALNYLELFLPTSLPPEHHHRGFKLWFGELVELWESFHNGPSWEYSLVNLFSRLTHDNIGHVDWTPYIPMIFTRFLRSFNLPVGKQPVISNKTNHCYEVQSTATWIVSMLGGPNNTAHEHVAQLFKALQTFYHPSNVGRWNLRLSSLLTALPKCFIRRVHRERYAKPSWVNGVPEPQRLTEENIGHFVECIKPVVFVAMFSKSGSQDASIALRYLSTMRPELMVPNLLEHMYPAMETLIEPHRLIACMNCIVAVVRPMLRAGKWYPAGPLHVLPLLNLSLPGIDSNDFKKCLVTFQMVSTFVSMVPIVDCSGAVRVRQDLTEEEREQCLATVGFEDWVLQFFHKVFSLIENSSQEASYGAVDRLNPEQSMLEVGMASTSTSVLQQCSAPIFDSALRRLRRFVTESWYETKVSGRFAANLCRAAAKVNPEKTLKIFLPHFCDFILNFVRDHEDLMDEEHLDGSFMWNLLLLSQLVRCDGREVLKYKDTLIDVLKVTLTLKCVQGYEIAGQLLRYLFRAVLLTYPTEYKSVNGSFDRPLDQYLITRDWAKPGDIHDLGIDWHIPTDQERAFASELLKMFLEPELKFIRTVSSCTQMSRDDLLRRLNIILECLVGSGCELPQWEGEAIKRMDSVVELTRFASDAHMIYGLTLDGRNIREMVADAVRCLLGYMETSCEDDTKGLFKIIKIYETLLFFYGSQKGDFDGRWKSFHIVKSALEDKMRGKKQHIRALLVDRAQLQHENRLLNSTNKAFTKRHQDICNDLFKLCMSRYSEVRKKAQSSLLMTFTNFPFSYYSILPDLVQNLKIPDIEEHKFKGTLYTILGSGQKCLAIKRNWEVLLEIWPALVQAQHSEKPSILKVIDDIVSRVIKCLESVAIKTKVHDPCVEAAAQFISSPCPRAIHPPATADDIHRGVEMEQAKTVKATEQYNHLVDSLANLVESEKLTWKFSQIGLEFMALLLRHDLPMPAKAVQGFCKKLCHDSLYIRKLAMAAVSAVLKQQKREHKEIPLDPYKISGTQPPPPGAPVPPGDRADNKWHQYNSSDLPDTRDKWEKATFVEKTHWGYNIWPKDMKQYAPFSEQPKVDRTRNELNEAEQAIYDFFINKQSVEKLISYLALEEQKGRDKFRSKYLILFKGLFRNFGSCFIENLKPSVERLVRDLSHDKHDSSQRCAMEIIGGILRGSKHWEYSQIVSLWDWIQPLLEFARNNVTVETLDDWGNFYSSISESRDPRKLAWVFDMLMKNPLCGEGGAFGDASRLYIIQNAMVQQEWRVPELLCRLLDYLTPHLAHNYKAVRDRIGSLLCTIFLYDYKIHRDSQGRSPTIEMFIQQILPQLEPLKDAVPSPGENNGIKNNSLHKPQHDATAMDTQEKSPEDEEERKAAIRLCKTVMNWLQNSYSRSFISSPREVFRLLPIICTLESESNDVDLKADCSTALACLSQSFVHPNAIETALHTIKEVAGLQSWHARAAILKYIQNMVFGNLFLLNSPQHKNTIQSLLLHLICDEQLEVREMAAMTLSGLLHCGFLNLDKTVMSHFAKLSQTKLKKKRHLAELQDQPLESLIQRHAGVLGLGACVQAYPYDVPEFIPQLLMDLSDHVNDPQPIQMSVKQTLSNFRRTHHDNWHDHKLKFTDDQLVVLTDLLVSPNYYA